MWKELIQLFKKDNLFEQAYQEAAGMLDTDAAMYDASVEALRRSDTAEVKFDIYDADKGVNRSERGVRKKVMTHLVVSGGTNLASGLSLVSVVIDIERIGDYTKNIYDLAVHHPLRLEGGPVEDKLQKVEAQVSSDFKSMVEVFKDRDEDKARLIMNNYKDGLSDACEEISSSILTGTVTGLNSSDATAVSLYARFLKRIASHSRNIVSSVVNPFHRIGYREK
jgi:phosphate transport system protein